MRRLYDSDDLFPGTLIDAYHAFQSVNFVTAHDGFCLYDLASYNHKHNEANNHNNTDGTNHNFSWNCGWEGVFDEWYRVADTSLESPNDFIEPGDEKPLQNLRYNAKARSIIVLTRFCD
jgi:pullulanase/glycogen debranching enzyme